MRRPSGPFPQTRRPTVRRGRPFPIALTAAVAMLAAACGPETVTGPALDAPASLDVVVLPGYPSTCAEVLAADPTRGDGEYALLHDSGHWLSVWCHGMSSGAPTEYLTLVNTGWSYNYSLYVSGTRYVRTMFTRVRLDPVALTVDVGELTFATTARVGTVHHSWTTHMPYGVAMSCNPKYPLGTANIDLTGTPLAMDDDFLVMGYLATGTPRGRVNAQAVNVQGGGNCGWNAPFWAWDPINPAPGRFWLQLAFTGSAENAAPVVTLAPVVAVLVGEAVAIDGTIFDAEGADLTISWDLGDGTTGTGAVPSTHRYGAAGTYRIEVTASDGINAPVTAAQFATVLSPADGAAALSAQVEEVIAEGVVSAKDAKPLLESAAQAASSLERGNVEAALGQLGAFENKLDALHRSGRIDEDAYQSLKAYVGRLKTSAGG